MAKKKKHTLELDREMDFEMIGICSHHSDYRLAWAINQQLELHLAKCDEDYCLTDKKGATSEHSMYEYYDDGNRLFYYLIKNKGQGKFLIPEKPSIDFFMFVCENMALDVDDIIKDLKEVSSILGVYPFDPEELPSAQNIDL